MGNHFVHEHPWGVDSWDEPEMKELMADPRVFFVKGSMCVWEMIGGGGDYFRKHYGWLTSSPEIAVALDKQCPNERGREVHRHVHLMGGKNTLAVAK